MKTTATLLMCLGLLIVSGCQEGNRISIWELTGHDAASITRIGYGQATEAGVSVKYWDVDRSGEYTPDAIGIYALQHLPLGSDPGQIPIPAWLEPFLLGMQVQPYAGGEISFPLKNRNEDEVFYLSVPKSEETVVYVNDKGREQDIRASVIGGAAFSLDPDFKWAIVVEVSTGDGLTSEEDDSGGPTADDTEVYIGGVIRF